MTSPRGFAEYIGFTDKEVKDLCEKYGVDYTRMESWYDGYIFPGIPHIYNPKSVVDAIRFREFSSYWTQTETYEALKIYIQMNMDTRHFASDIPYKREFNGKDRKCFQ